MRFSVAQGPADADADGFLDGVDRCPAGYSTRDKGCRRFGQAIRLRELDDGRLDVFIRSENSSCSRRPVVELFRVVDGPDRLVARGKRSAFKPPPMPGSYYASVAPEVTERARCRGARSAEVGVGPSAN